MPHITDFRAVYLPYCLEQQADGTWVVLNRYYQPVGFNTSEPVPYKEYPVYARLVDISPGTVEKLSQDKAMINNRIYLYSSISSPVRSDENMDAYMKKLAILADLEILRES